METVVEALAAAGTAGFAVSALHAYHKGQRNVTGMRSVFLLQLAYSLVPVIVGSLASTWLSLTRGVGEVPSLMVWTWAFVVFNSLSTTHSALIKRTTMTPDAIEPSWVAYYALTWTLPITLAGGVLAVVMLLSSNLDAVVVLRQCGVLSVITFATILNLVNYTIAMVVLLQRGMDVQRVAVMGRVVLSDVALDLGVKLACDLILLVSAFGGTGVPFDVGRAAYNVVGLYAACKLKWTLSRVKRLVAPVVEMPLITVTVTKTGQGLQSASSAGVFSSLSDLESWGQGTLSPRSEEQIVC